MHIDKIMNVVYRIKGCSLHVKKEIDDLRKGLNMGSVEQALRGVKEYAARSGDLSVDTLQLKLMRLEDVARRMDHKDN